MSTVINIKVDPKVKFKAQKVAADLGLTLSRVINVYLHQFIRTEDLHVSLRGEKPSLFLISAIKEAEADKHKKVGHSFPNSEAAVGFIDKVISKEINK